MNIASHAIEDLASEDFVIIPGSVGTVGGVDTRGEASSDNSGHCTNVPLGSVEAEDVDGVEGLETKLDEGLGHGLDVVQVLSIGPLDPLVVPLHSHGDSIRIPGHSVVQHRPYLTRDCVKSDSSDTYLNSSASSSAQRLTTATIDYETTVVSSNYSRVVLTEIGFSWQSGCLSLNLSSTAPSGQVVERVLEGRILSGPTLSPRLV